MHKTFYAYVLCFHAIVSSHIQKEKDEHYIRNYTRIKNNCQWLWLKQTFVFCTVCSLALFSKLSLWHGNPFIELLLFPTLCALH